MIGMKLGSKGSIKNVGGQNAEAETANPNQPAPLEIEEEILTITRTLEDLATTLSKKKSRDKE